MIIALFPNILKHQSKSVAIDVQKFLTRAGVTVALEDVNVEDIGGVPFSGIDLQKVDYTISIGGDGTILRLAHRYPDLQAPILGLNLGSLGFLADVPGDDVYGSLQNLIDGNFQISSRVVMQGQRSSGETCFAMNEFVIHRAQNPCLIDLAVYVDDIYVNSFSADGIIVATPSGSTAYSLAAGGPILAPRLEALVITPIAPHTISNRPIVLMPEREIRIQYISHYDPVELTYDGFSSFLLSSGEVFSISRSDRVFRLISMPHHDYFSTLRTKLGWSGRLRM